MLGTPTVDIGDRQKGRLMAESVIHCEPEYHSILSAVKKAERTRHQAVGIYGNGSTSAQITEIIKSFFREDRIDLKKGFYDNENTFSDSGARRE